MQHTLNSMLIVVTYLFILHITKYRYTGMTVFFLTVYYRPNFPIPRNTRQTTGRNDGGVRRQAVTSVISGELPYQIHLQAARLASRRPVTALRTSTPSQSRYQFIDPKGMKGLVDLSTCE